jgi:hypothetical protein
MNESNFTKALFDALSPEYEKNLSDHETDYVFSEKFNKDMQKLIKRRKKPYYKLINTFGKRVACILAIFLIASSVTIMSVDALRNTVANFFVEIYEKFTTVQSEEISDAPMTIEDIYDITYDLSGFSIDFENSNDYSRNISYVNGDISIDFQQYTKEMYDEDLNTEGTEISTIDINNHEAIYFRDNHQYDCLIWDNGDYIMVIYSNIGKDALIDIAKSVQKVE